MKKNKTVAFMLAATLLVGGAFVGTKSMFYNEDVVENQLVITMGSVAVEAEVQGWHLMELGTTEGVVLDGTHAVNVKPGDTLSQTVKITNEGTLNQQLDAVHEDLTNIETPLPKGIEIKTNKDDIAGKILKPGESLYFKMDLIIDKDVQNQTLDKFMGHTLDITTMIPQYVIIANQLN